MGLRLRLRSGRKEKLISKHLRLLASKQTETPTQGLGSHEGRSIPCLCELESIMVLERAYGDGASYSTKTDLTGCAGSNFTIGTTAQAGPYREHAPGHHMSVCRRHGLLHVSISVRGHVWGLCNKKRSLLLPNVPGYVTSVGSEPCYKPIILELTRLYFVLQLARTKVFLRSEGLKSKPGP